jgi:PAS domain S-box-containing protein
MRRFRARDALSNAVLSVRAEDRLAQVESEVDAIKATHLAVFDNHCFCGLISLAELGFSRSERIFVDLISSTPTPCLLEDALIEEVGRFVESSRSGGVVIKNADNVFLGVVTAQSLLSALLLIAYTRGADAAEAAEERHRDLLESSPDAMLIISQSGAILQTNRHVEALFGYEANELTGALVEQLIPENRRERHANHRHAYFASPSRRSMGIELDLMGRRKDGTVFPVEINVTPLIIATVPHAVAAIRSVTSQRDAAAALKTMNGHLQRTLEELSSAQRQVIQQERLRALGQMASGVAHDLNNTLSPIQGYADLLARETDLPEMCREYVRLIQTSAMDAAAVVERLREFYRPSSSEVGHECIDLAELLRRIPALTRPKWRDESQRTGRLIRVAVAARNAVWVNGVATQLREVFTNLVFNAVDAMPRGGKLTLAVKTCDSFAVVEVIDTGIGMTPDVVARCFDPFFTTKGAEGNGLGLSVCHGIVQRWGGHIEVDSQPNEGTTIRVWLPLATENEILSIGDRAIALLPEEKRILYIDDDSRLRLVMQKLFDSLGQQVVMAGGGVDGLAEFRDGEFDIVVTDLGMPEIDGREVIQIIKSIRPKTPVILVTGWGEGVDDDWDERYKPDYLLAKPVSVVSLRDALCAVLESSAPAANGVRRIHFTRTATP